MEANRGGKTTIDSAQASDLFDKFCNATTLKQILGYHRQLCDVINLKPTHFPQFYPKLKQYVDSWRAKALWKKFDARAGHKCYAKGKACSNTRVLIIGGGPCGLRAAIDAQLLGAKVVVVEKRDRMSRNNVLHLWPFVIEDLRALGAKKFFGKFCAGSIDHISIRQLQCILMKVALLLGVEIHTEVSFSKLLTPPSKEESQERVGWRGLFSPVDHPVSQYEFDVLIGADGRRNTLEGFKRKEFRGRLAIAITANFINKRTEAEARVEEISGVAFIFNQKFFKDLYEETGIDLENIVYYKDDTHYFVMTAKKQSLLDKGVILNDISDTSKLLGRENVDVEALQNYAREAADFSTMYQMPDLEFAVNHYGYPDVTMFDFTSMYAAENASKVIERNGYRLLMILVGDSLLEPFWPTGSGCARGFLSSLDACWAIRSWSLNNPLEVLAERESIYRLLGQTTPENLHRDHKGYMLDPCTRYPNLNKSTLLPVQVIGLFDSDDNDGVQRMITQPSTQELHKKRRRKDSQVHPDTLLLWLKRQVEQHEDLVVENLTSSFKDGLVLCAIIHRYRPDLLDYQTLSREEIAQNNQLAFDILERELGVPPVMTGLEMEKCDIPDFLTMLSYLTHIYDTFRGEIPHIKHPKLDIPEPKKIERPPIHVAPLRENNSLSHRANALQNSSTQPRQSTGRHRKHIETPAVFTQQGAPDRKNRKRRSAEKIGTSLERDTKLSGLLGREKDEEFSGRIKDFEDKLREQAPQEKKPKDLLRAIGKIDSTDWNIKEIEKKIHENKLGKPINKEKEKVPKWSREQFLARQTKIEKRGLDRQDSEDKKFATIDKTIKQIDQKLKEGNIRQQGQNKVSAITEQFTKQPETEAKPAQVQRSTSRVMLPASGGSESCHFCTKRVYLMERLSAEGRFFHRGCFRCQYCNTMLRLGSYMFDREGRYGHKFYCTQHFGMQGELKGQKIRPSSGKVRNGAKTPEKRAVPDITVVDLVDRVETPERVGFSNMSGVMSEQEESFSQMDEDEWTDKNFGASTAELGSSDEESDSSDSSGSESDDDEEYEEALEAPATKEGTQRLVENWKKRYSKDRAEDSAGSSEDYDTGSDQSYENSSDEDESDTATEGEEEIRARELRKQEVRVEPPILQTDTGSDTEIASDEEDSISSSEKENSATEITTDSEFDHDDTTPTREIPSISLNDIHVSKQRGTFQTPKKVQVKSGELQRPINSQKSGNIQLKMTQISAQPVKIITPDLTNVRPSPLINPRRGDYMLNRTQSTGGIATKISLELKKKYLLESSALTGNIQKSGSATALDTKLKSFHSNISEHQKLLNPAPEISPTMQAFLQGTSKLHQPLSPVFTPKSPTFNIESKFEQKTNIENIEPKENKPLQSPEIIEDVKTTDKLLMQPDITKDILLEEKYKETENCESPKESQPDIIYTNDTEGRPRSPVHETSIIVPEITWDDKPEKKSETDIETDSLSSENSDNQQKLTKVFSDIPQIEVRDSSGELLEENDFVMDSLCIIPEKSEEKTISESSKSILSEKKTLNQPKPLPVIENGLKCHEVKEEREVIAESGRSTPLSNSDHETGAHLTETELSDWARDGAVSDNLDVEFDIEFNKTKKSKKKKSPNAKIANQEDFEDHICGRNLIPSTLNGPIADFDSIEYMDTGSEISCDDIVQTTNPVIKNTGYVQFIHEEPKPKIVEEPKNNNQIIEAVNENFNIPIGDQNTGYCVFGNEEEIINFDKPNDIKLEEKCDNEDDSLLNVEAGTTTEENTCSDSTVKIVNPANLELDLPKETEENKNEEEELATPIVEQKEIVEYDEHVQRLKSKYAEFGFVKDSIDIRKSKRKSKSQSPPSTSESKLPEIPVSPTFTSPVTSKKLDEINRERNKQKDLIHDLVMDKVKARRSLDKKRKLRDSFSPNNSPVRSFDLSKSATVANVLSENNNTKNLTLTLENKNEKPLGLQKSPTVIGIPESHDEKENSLDDVFIETKAPEKLPNLDITPTNEVTKLPSLTPEPRPNLIPEFKKLTRPLSVIESPKIIKEYTLPKTPLTNPEAFSLPDIHDVMKNEFKTPIAPPRIKHDEAKRTAEKLKQDAKARARLKSDEDLGLSPEDRMNVHRQKLLKARSTEEPLKKPESILLKNTKSVDECIQDSIESLVINTEKRNALLQNDTLKKKKPEVKDNLKTPDLHNSFSSTDISTKLTLFQEDLFNKPNRTKSVSALSQEELKKPVPGNIKRTESQKANRIFYKSDPNLLTDVTNKDKKSKDRERSKSIIKSFTDFFHKKKDVNVKPNTSGVKERFRFRISPKSKEKSKSCINLDQNMFERPTETEVRRKSLTETTRDNENPSPTPPPIPPPPLNYIAQNSRDDSGGSDGESEWKKLNNSTDTLDKSLTIDSTSSLSGRRISRSLRKANKQAQIKRHRQAQEIQRKLEETEVKTRELEQRGVVIEKLFRGEVPSCTSSDETELLKEWFKLMQDLTELRRYEKELLMRAQELEYEDRHARLQQELRDRLTCDDSEKTAGDLSAEANILAEMLDIVAKRDSLIALLEEDRQRYHEEDRDFEAQMLAKGLMLTPIKKNPD